MRPVRAAAALALSAVAAIGLSGCFGGGGDDSAAVDDPSLAAAPALPDGMAQPIAAVVPGQTVVPGTSTPAAFAKALARHQVVVVAFTMPGVADDDAAIAALRAVRAGGSTARGVAYFVYALGQARAFGDLPDLLGVTISPTIAVIGRDGVLKNFWEGLIDEELLRQSIADAQRTRPAPGAAQDPGLQVQTGNPVASGPTGSPAGIALARKVDRAYAKAKGVSLTMRMDGGGGQPGTATMRWALDRGRNLGLRGELRVPGRGAAELVMNGSGTFARLDGTSCWVQVNGTPADTGLALGDSAGHWSKPRRVGDAVVVTVTDEDGPTTLKVDPETGRIKTLTMQRGRQVLSDLQILDRRPEIPNPQPAC